jgi:hypothetical protein
MAITLLEVESAITAVQDSGQSSTVDGISYSRANLSALISLRDKLKGEAGRTAGSRPVFRGFSFTTAGYD